MVTISNSKESYVYIMSNISFSDDLLKIGWTREHPSIRASNMYSTEIPTPFIVEFVIITKEGSKLKRIIHEYIKHYRVNSNREFFKISKDKLKEILINELNLDIIDNLSNIPINNIKKNNIIFEILNLYNNLEKNVNQFLDKLKQNKTELRLDENNNKIIRVYVYHFTLNDKEYEIAGNCLNYINYFDDWILNVINRCKFIEIDKKDHKKTLDYLLNNTEEIKNKLGKKQFRSDNISFRNDIIKTQQELDKLLNDYIWEF